MIAKRRRPMPTTPICAIGARGGLRGQFQTGSAVAARVCTVYSTVRSEAGEKLLAREFREHSNGVPVSFIPDDCTNLTSSLFGSLLFGDVEGAFTGAVRGRRRLIRSAEGGRLFLGEIGGSTLDVQSCFLRVLEDRSEVAAMWGKAAT